MTKRFLTPVLTVAAAVTLMTSTVFAASSVSDTQEIVSSKETVQSTSEITFKVDGVETTMTVSEAVEKGEIKLDFVAATEKTLTEAGVKEEAVTEIVNLNKATAEEKETVLTNILAKATSATSEAGTVKKETLSLLTNVQDLTFTTKTGEVIKDATNVTVTWKAPLVSGMNTDNIRVLHYSTVNGEWELIKPDAVDPATGSITAFFSNLSPVAIVYVDEEKVAALDNTPSTSDDSSVSDGSVKTGDSNNAIVYVVILAGAAIAATGVCVARKKSSKTR